MFRMSVLILGLGLAAASSGPASADPDDDPPPSCPTPSTSCPTPGDYAVVKPWGFHFPQAHDCSIYLHPKYDSWIRRCVEPWSPPPEVELWCAREPFGVLCQASPEGPEVGFTWILSDSLEAPVTEPGSAYLSASCRHGYGNGTVQVLVSGPSGAYGEASVSFSCDPNDHSQPIPN